MKNAERRILTKGLTEGYVGNGISGSTNRAGFDLKTSDYKGPEGEYHDEWAANYNGGGQELSKTPDGESFTRVYIGGTLSAEELQSLGLVKKDVIGKLVFFVSELGGQTRLDQDAEMEDGRWRYGYKVIRKSNRIPAVVGEETITYDQLEVFLHYHGISPVK
jgi:hypothetical protein